MRHNAFFKLIALLLCTVSLLGAVGSGLGLIAMTSGNLYNRTVEELIEEQIQSQGADRAHTLAVRYASTSLGGMPAQLVKTRFPNYYSGILNDSYSYAILDAEGNVVNNAGSAADGKSVYSFPVTGQYMHLVSLMNEAEKYPSRQPSLEVPANAIMEGNLYVYNAIPPEGTSVCEVIHTYANANNTYHDAGPSLGSVYYLQDGSITCLFHEPGGLRPNETVTEITLISSNGELLYEASCPEGVGYFTFNGSSMMFVSTIPPEVTVTETAASETVAETIPETTAETIPETTEATIPPTTEPEVVIEVENNIPQDTKIEITSLKVTFVDGETVSHTDDYGLGRIRHKEDGSVHFSSYEPWESETGTAAYIRFRDEDGETVFEASSVEGVGELYYDGDHLIFDFTPPVPEETVPETTVETVPETAATIVMETVAETVPETTAQLVLEETVPDVTEPMLINGKPLAEYEINTDEYFDYETQQTMYAEYVYIPMPEYTVELYLTEDSLLDKELYEILEIVRMIHPYLLPALGGCLLVFLLSILYLFTSAARKPKTDVVHAGGLNRIPLDLYLTLAGFGIPMFLALAYESRYLLRQDQILGCTAAVSCVYAACALTVGFLFAAAAQFKTPDGYWWRNTLIGHFFRLCGRFAIWSHETLAEKGMPKLAALAKRTWKFTCRVLVWTYRKTEALFLWSGHKMGSFLAWLGGLTHRFLILLPLTWQWLAVGFVMFLMMALVLATNGEELLVVLSMGFCIALIIYGAQCFGTLMDSAKKMRRGDLNAKVDDKMMVGSFKEFAEELNALAGVAVLAAQKQLKSERMKTELITNVSHDIKTPLTSIINYVDLLQKPHTEEEGEQYLEVLSRQSQQLKKLIEDLMDMSKASTGNMSVEITYVDAVESVNQALGEFSDKLEKAQIVPVFRHSSASVPMLADGRLVWRVLSNLLGNAVKYAMPGTRLYIDLMELDNNVIISMKNISREELSIDADELMERFVRGDDSRNTEGSGLGLNIAKSLMELQKGQMQLLVDGDLFKVTLSFPGA